MEKAEAANVTVLDGDANRTNLPEGCCDAVFMRSVYHHFEDPAAMNRSLRDSLRPGGRLAVMDFTPPNGAEASSPAGRDEDGHHGVTPETVLKELVQAGFKRVQVEERDARGFLVVVRKPADRSSLTHFQ
jgi:SAM-dependent methyltransferase